MADYPRTRSAIVLAAIDYVDASRVFSAVVERQFGQHEFAITGDMQEACCIRNEAFEVLCQAVDALGEIE